MALQEINNFIFSYL